MEFYKGASYKRVWRHGWRLTGIVALTKLFLIEIDLEILETKGMNGQGDVDFMRFVKNKLLYQSRLLKMN